MDANGGEKHPKNRWRVTRRRGSEEGYGKHYSTNDNLNAAGQEEFSVSERFPPTCPAPRRLPRLDIASHDGFEFFLDLAVSVLSEAADSPLDSETGRLIVEVVETVKEPCPATDLEDQTFLVG